MEMSWGIWKKLKSGVGKAVGFVKNLLNRAPKAIEKVSKTARSIGNIAGTVRDIVSKPSVDDDSDIEDLTDVDDEPSTARVPRLPPVKRGALKTKSKSERADWRKMLNTDSDDSDGQYNVSYAGRNWKPRMKTE